MFSSVSSYLHIFLLAFLSLYLFWCYISFNWTIKFNFLLKLSIVFLIRVFIYGSKMNNWIMFIYIKYIVFNKNYPGPCHKAWLWAHDWRKGLIVLRLPGFMLWFEILKLGFPSLQFPNILGLQMQTTTLHILNSIKNFSNDKFGRKKFLV